MSKIGRKPIALGSVSVTVSGQNVVYKGKKVSGEHMLPDTLTVQVENGSLMLVPKEKNLDVNQDWGLHRALLFNKIRGADADFEKQLRIVGLGFKAALSGKKVQLSLGYSHKIDFELPAEVSLEIDKTGQQLTFRSPNKELLGHVCSEIRAFRMPEPYKGTGIKYSDEVIIRKAGKAKSS